MSKETNEARMTGILPSQGADPIPVGKIPDGGTQVVQAASAQNATSTIHTVTAGKTLYASLMVLSIRNSSEAAGYVYITVTNAVDAEQYMLALLHKPGGDGSSVAMPFMPPLEIPAGYKIKIVAAGVNVFGYGLIHGYEA